MPLSRLNPQQYAAATAPRGHNLIIASAGTGKTSTIVGRIAHLLSQGVGPEAILLLTFTNKAAQEMIERVAHYFGHEVAGKIDAGTFHAVSYRWLKRHEGKVVLKQPRELKTLFRSVYEKRTFSHIDHPTPPVGATYLYDWYSFYQNTQLHDGFDTWIEREHAEHTPYAPMYADIIDEFEELKREYGFVHFNDLLIHMRTLAQHQSLGYSEILIDEYQDTNALQGTLVDAMDPPSLFCVGDYDQSIYAFNGADIGIIARFDQTYPDARIYTLSQNYRSTLPILSLANHVIAYNERIYPKELQVTRTTYTHTPTLLRYEELFEQYHGIASRIAQSRTPHDHIAVIFRNNASADGIEAALRERAIPARRRGGMSFFDAKEIKALLDTYTLWINPTDMMAFVHVCEYTMGSALATELFIALKRLGGGSLLRGLFEPDMSLSNPFKKRRLNYQLGLFDDFSELSHPHRFSKLPLDPHFAHNPILRHIKLTKENALFLNDWYHLFKELQSSHAPSMILGHIARSAMYHHIVQSLLHQRSLTPQGVEDERLRTQARERLERKIGLLHELSRPYKEHERFLNAMILGSQDLTQGEGVHLLSIHASKGLEYTEVYVIDLMDGRFPNRKLMGRSGSIEEERRLFYVAVTRAKEELYLSFAAFDKIKSLTFIPSQFLYEANLLPKDEHYDALTRKKET